LSKFKESAGMNLGMILNAPYPVDTLVKKETDALIQSRVQRPLALFKKQQ